MRIATALLLCLGLATSASAADTWTRPFAGVKRLTRTTTGPNQRINALFVDLDMPGVKLAVTPYSLRRRTTSSLGRALKAQAAVNGDFFNTSTYAVNGLAVARGVQYPGSRDDDWNGTLQFNSTVSRVEMTSATTVQAREAWMFGAISGHPTLVQGGTVLDRTGGVCNQAAPRTGVGLTADGRTLVVVVVDGRSSTSAGMTCNAFGRLMRNLGATTALNFDGGGSTDMWVAGKGVVNRPSDGAERVVANHLAIFAQSTAKLGVIQGTVTRSDNGAPLANVVVKIQTGKSVKTDSKGAWKLGVPAGTYFVTFTRAGFNKATIKRVVAAKKTTKAPVKLVRTPTTPGTQGIAGDELTCIGAACTADTDADGVRDAEDDCPTISNATQVDSDDDGEGDACDVDGDDDGVKDSDDNCPLVANEEQTDSDADGNGDACEADAPAEASDEECADEACELETDESGEDEEAGGCASAGAGILAMAALGAIRRRRALT